jgi:protease-4
MRNFLKYTFASILGTIVGAGILGTLGIGGLIFLLVGAVSSKDTAGPKVENQSVLVFDLSLAIADTKPASSTAEALSETLSDDDSPDTMTLRSVLDALKTASEDDRIVGLYLHGSTGGTPNNYATLQEIRQELERFRDAGKQIVAYDMDWTEQEYYLGSVADSILLNPMGLMEINGLASEATFFTGALDKFGIGVQVTRVGKYKSAVEPFLLTERSPESKQQTQKLLNDIWGNFVEDVDRSRDFSKTELEQVVNTQGILTATQAQDNDFVDDLIYFDQVVQDLKELTNTDEAERTFRQISLPTYAKVAETNEELPSVRQSDNQVAILYAEGEIVNGYGTPNQIGGDRLAKELRDLRLDDEVKAVVMRVNSPGGSATASDVIRREVELTREVKPVVVSMGNVAASGGYWISTYGSRIFAEPTTITGSIGVLGLLLNVQELAQNNGITWDVVKTNPLADFDTISRPKTPAEMARIQSLVDLIYENFLTIVSETRNMSKEQVNTIAQGRVWSGQEAKNIGLVDEIGGLNEAIASAAELAELKDDWKLKEYPKQRSWEERLIEKFLGVRAVATNTPADPLTIQLENLKQDLAVLRNLNDPIGAYARLPFNIRID